MAPLIGGDGESDEGVRMVRWARAVAGPALIVAGPAIVLREFWLWGRLTAQHVDLLAFWLPRWCSLGGAISAGHVPTWLPNQFGGVPFVSDPQSGWLYAPVMSLFSAFPCARALDVMIALNPILAGLGLYLFFRHERVGRPAATVAGLTIALTMSSSTVILSMPFSATLAWTAISLAGAAGFLHGRTAPKSLAWLGFTAFALTQVAAAQLTDGLLIAAIAMGPYLLARSVLQVRAGEVRPVTAILRAGGLVAAFPLLAAAVLLPRLALLPRTSIGHGYVELGRLASQLSGTPFNPPLAQGGVSPWWGTSFARGPGGYVGALALLLIPVALTSRRWRLPALGFALAGFVGWLVNLDALITDEGVRSFALKFGVGELWLRSPDRFKYLLILAFAALAGYGVQAWLELRPVATFGVLMARWAWLVPGLAVFALWPLAMGSRLALSADFLAGFVAGSILLLAIAQGRSFLAPGLAGLVAAELLIAGLVAPLAPGTERTAAAGTGPDRFGRSFFTLRHPVIEPSAYLTAGPIGTTLVAARGDFGRYLTFDPRAAAGSPSGFLGLQERRFWPAYENARSILFGIEEIQGYSPVQLDRYWRLVRRVDTRPVAYNASTFQSVPPEVLRLFGVEWLILPTTEVPPVPAAAVAGEGAYTLYRLEHSEPRASFVSDWEVVPAGAGLDIVLRPGFDPAVRAIVEGGPQVDGTPVSPQRSGTGTAVYTEASPEDVRVQVTANSAGLVVVRNAFDRNWHATVDGRPAAVMPTDYLMQGVAVPAGTHTVELTYRDRWVGYGLLVSGAAWLALIASMAWLAVRGRARARRSDAAGGSSVGRPVGPVPISQPSPP